MKKCVLCRAQIELMVPLTVCSGGLGTICEVKADIEEEPKPSTSDAVQNLGLPLMNNGGRDLTNTNDIQKLQQQLQDIKEQVNIFIWGRTGFYTSFVFVDNVSSLLGSPKKYDFPVWTRVVPNVRRSNDRVPYLQKSGRKTYLALLDTRRRTVIQLS